MARTSRISSRSPRLLLCVLVAGLVLGASLPGRADEPDRTSPPFGPVETYGVGADPESIGIAELTGDTLPDVVVSTAGRIFDANTEEYKIFVYPQQADGTLGAPAA